MGEGFTQLDEAEIFRGYIIRVAQGTFRGPDGSTFTRDLVRHPGAVAVVPVLGDDLVFVRQYRAPIDAHLLEIPAGIKDADGEAPIDTARRELIEETGFEAGHVEPLTSYVAAAGFSDEEVEIFLATDLHEVGAAVQGIEEQHMTVERYPLDDAVGLIASGELRDAKSVIGVLLTLRHLGR